MLKQINFEVYLYFIMNFHQLNIIFSLILVNNYNTIFFFCIRAERWECVTHEQNPVFWAVLDSMVARHSAKNFLPHVYRLNSALIIPYTSQPKPFITLHQVDLRPCTSLVEDPFFIHPFILEILSFSCLLFLRVIE